MMYGAEGTPVTWSTTQHPVVYKETDGVPRGWYHLKGSVPQGRCEDMRWRSVAAQPEDH